MSDQRMTRRSEIDALIEWNGEIAYADCRMRERALRLELSDQDDDVTFTSAWSSLEARVALLRDFARLDRDRQALRAAMIHGASVDVFAFHGPPILRPCDRPDA
jgi:hypothetical protein